MSARDPFPNVRTRLTVILLTRPRGSADLRPCPAAAVAAKTATKVSVQLDWTPNTNHIGIYVALAKGWYKDAGLDVEILPYTDVQPGHDRGQRQGRHRRQLPAQPDLLARRRARPRQRRGRPADATSPSWPCSTPATSSGPRDFDGKTYAGFGLPYEEPQIKTVIKADGGKGDFDTATLSTAAYEALYNKRADFTEIFTAWEGIEAELRGIKLRTFRYDALRRAGLPRRRARRQAATP